MADSAERLMEVDEFLLWCLDQEDRYELVDGVPVKMVEEVMTPDGPKMMTGASGLHDRIVVHLIGALHAQLRGSPCRPTTAAIGVKTKFRSVRRPDVAVTCDEVRADRYDANPKLIVEVLSPSNRGVSWQRKLDEYWRLDAPQYVLLVEQTEPRATLFRATALSGSRPIWMASTARSRCPASAADCPWPTSMRAWPCRNPRRAPSLPPSRGPRSEEPRRQLGFFRHAALVPRW